MTRHSTFDVGIVGAGVSGVSLALFLKRRGLSSVVLEKADRLGGKTWSYDLESDALDGSISELGACYLADDYDAVAALAAEHGLKTEPLGAVDAEPDSLVGQFYKKTPFGRIVQAVVILTTLVRYRRRRRKVLEAFAAGDPVACTALALPTREWLRREDCEGLLELMALLVDRFGYGPIDSMPALYALRWVTPALVTTAMRRSTRQLDLGFSELIRRMAEGQDVRLDTPFKGAERGADGCWTLVADDGPLTVRHLVFACPPTQPPIAALFDVARREVLERDVVSTPYVCALAQVRDWFDGRQLTTMKAGDHRDQLLGARRDGTAADGSAWCACYLYPSTDDPAHIEAVLRQEIATRGGRMERLVALNRASDFLPHAGGEAIRTGRYFELERRQGQDSLWLCNAILAHENWRDLVALSGTMADKIAAAM